jgi:hypothetical protein
MLFVYQKKARTVRRSRDSWLGGFHGMLTRRGENLTTQVGDGIYLIGAQDIPLFTHFHHPVPAPVIVCLHTSGPLCIGLFRLSLILSIAALPALFSLVWVLGGVLTRLRLRSISGLPCFRPAQPRLQQPSRRAWFFLAISVLSV